MMLTPEEREMKSAQIKHLRGDFVRDIPAGPYVYELFHVHGMCEALEYLGYVDFNCKQIYIDADLSEVESTVTLLHELTHIALTHYGCKPDAEQREEIICDAVAHVIAQAGFRFADVF